MEITDIKKDTQHVYVLNNTKTDVSITVKDDDGVSRLVRILRASVPQDAAEIVGPLVLKRTASFKRALSQNILTLVSEKDAKEALSKPEAKIELAAIKKKLSRIPQELMLESTKEVTPLEAISGGASDPTVRTEVKDIAVSTEDSADDKFARLIAIHNEEPLTHDEITWLLSRLSSKTGENNEILDWLKTKA